MRTFLLADKLRAYTAALENLDFNLEEARYARQAVLDAEETLRNARLHAAKREAALLEARAKLAELGPRCADCDELIDGESHSIGGTSVVCDPCGSRRWDRMQAHLSAVAS